jgi:quercetin dioxygenase-like cupin family protein
MLMSSRHTLLLLLPLLLGSNAFAHPAGEHPRPDRFAVLTPGGSASSAANHELVTIDGITGPKNTIGVSSIEPLGVIDLGEEFRSMRCREMRAREFTIEPGGVIGIHAHEQRPGYAFVVSGTIVEHRNDHPEPVVRGAGEISMEQAGVVHWWENRSSEPVKALVVDIFTPEKKSFRRCLRPDRGSSSVHPR